MRDGDDWVLNGTKAWVTSGTKARRHHRRWRAPTTPDERRGARGISAFIVTPDLPGFSVGKKEDKMGLRASPTVQLSFDDMRVPGGPSARRARAAGFIYAMQSLDNGRLGIAAQAIGIAEAALEHAIDVCGRAEAVRQADQGIPGDSVQARRHGARASPRRARCCTCPRRRRTAASTSRSSASMAKLLASETAMWVTTQAMQIFGGYGYVKEYPVERLFRDAKVTEIYEGTSEIQRIVIARELYSRILSTTSSTHTI